MPANCAMCGELVDIDAHESYQEVISWVSGPKLDGPKLRERTGRYAHKACVEHLVSGQAVDQPELFGDEFDV